MSKTTAKQVIAAKIEVTYATDPTPDGTNGMMVSNLQYVPFAGSVSKRNRAHATYGADKHTLIGEYRTITFDVEVGGSGAAGTAPLYGPLLRGSGMSETVTASTKVEYKPISSAQESLVIYFNWDGILHVMLGARGTVSWKFNGGQLPMMSFSFSGLASVADVDAAALAVETTLASFVDGVECNKANTTTFTIATIAAAMESIQIDLGNKVTFRDRPNAAYVALNDREITGNVSFEAVTIAAKAWFAAAKAGTTGALAMTHGTTAGNIVQLAAPVFQFEQPSYADGDGTLLVASPFGLKRTVGDDELVFTVK